MPQISIAVASFPRLGSFLLLGALYACGSSSSSGLNGAACATLGSCSEDTTGDGGSVNGRRDPPPGTGSSSGGAESGAGGGVGAVGSASPPVTNGPHFSGSGSSFRPLTPGCGPDTASQCTGACEQGTGAVPT